MLALARHRERGEHRREDRQAEHEEPGPVELSRVAAGIEPEPRRRLDGRDRRAAERPREGARDLAGAAADQLAVLPSVASTSTCASTGRWRRISRSKCSGMMTAARARPLASIVSGDVAGGRVTTR